MGLESRRVFVFVLYAIGIWYAAAVHRRRAAGYLWVGAGVLGMVVVAYAHALLNYWTNGAIRLPVLQSLLWPYTIMVMVVGVYIASLPRARVLCRRCSFDLTDAQTPGGRCPSCQAVRAHRVRGHRCAVCRYDLSGQDESHGHCPECASYFTHLARPRAARLGGFASPEAAEPAEFPSESRSERRGRLLRHLASGGGTGRGSESGSAAAGEAKAGDRAVGAGVPADR